MPKLDYSLAHLAKYVFQAAEESSVFLINGQNPQKIFCEFIDNQQIYGVFFSTNTENFNISRFPVIYIHKFGNEWVVVKQLVFIFISHNSVTEKTCFSTCKR